jgi:aromatic ring-opening dioxygenase catalytic subunit (LigB family)
MEDARNGFTRRGAIAAGLVGAAGLAGLAGLASAGGAASAGPRGGDGPAKGEGDRMPVVYIPHGGGPWPFVDLGFGDKSELDALAAYLRSVRSAPAKTPAALLVISAHWEEPVPTVMTSARPPMLYDYYGFPPEAYRITWPAPGHPRVAARVRELLGAAGIETGSDAERGFDHGTFVPLKLAYPEADVPTVQLSLKQGLDPAEHLAIGRALAPLRDEGVFIVGSGMSFHNLRAFRSPGARPVAEAFDGWLRETVPLAATERDARLVAWSSAPAARQAHPREEHLLPLMVVAGAAGEERGTVTYEGTLTGVRISGCRFG